jgi:hypothetical protein
VRLGDPDDSLGQLRRGEVIELTVSKPAALAPLLAKLDGQLRADHLRAVPVARLLNDAQA